MTMLPYWITLAIIASLVIGFYFAQRKSKIPLKDRICVKCKFCEYRHKEDVEAKYRYYCTHPNTVRIDIVTGLLSEFKTCKSQRDNSYPCCSYDGSFFEPK